MLHFLHKLGRKAWAFFVAGKPEDTGQRMHHTSLAGISPDNHNANWRRELENRLFIRPVLNTDSMWLCYKLLRQTCFWKPLQSCCCCHGNCWRFRCCPGPSSSTWRWSVTSVKCSRKAQFWRLLQSLSIISGTASSFRCSAQKLLFGVWALSAGAAQRIWVAPFGWVLT